MNSKSLTLFWLSENAFILMSESAAKLLIGKQVTVLVLDVLSYLLMGAKYGPSKNKESMKQLGM